MSEKCLCLTIKGNCFVCDKGLHIFCNATPHGDPEEAYVWFKEHPEYTKTIVPLTPSPEHARALEEIKKEEDASK